MGKPLLSICIPTYNRSWYLKNCLNSIICQHEFRTGSVEIIISDNASTDDTQFVVQEYTKIYNNIKYFKNPNNICDQNFPLALSRGNGVFRKLSNDTFLYAPNSLSYLCDLVRKYKNSKKPLVFLDGKGKNLQGEVVECTCFDKFVETVGSLIYWTGVFGVWVNECDEVTKNISGCELMLWQCRALYDMVAIRREVIFINRRLFFVQEVNGKNLSYGVYQVLHLNFLSILKGYVDQHLLSQEIYEKVRIENLYHIFIPFLTRGEHKSKQWNFPDKEKVKEMVISEAKDAGCWRDYQKHYNVGKYIIPIRTNIKIIILEMYCKYLHFRVGIQWERHRDEEIE